MSVLSIFGGGRKAKIEKYKELQKLCDYDFLDVVAPRCGVSFRHERFVDLGEGYEACLYIYKYPKDVPQHWLDYLVNTEGTVSVLDVASLDPNVVKKNLNRSMEEQISRGSSARSNADLLDAQQKLDELQRLQEEVTQYGAVMKTLCARIYIPAKTLADVDEKIKDLTAELEGAGYKCGVCLNETKQDWQNALLSYSQQQKDMLYKRSGQALLSKTFALGNPFHFTHLMDPYGFNYGLTTTGGSVLLDLYRVTQKRMSFNSVIVGKMGSGKSTTLKKMLVDRAARGDYVRVLDVAKEFEGLVTHYGGKVISLDGESNNIINALQILQSDEGDMKSYNHHITKVVTIYKYLKKTASEEEVLIFKRLLRGLYIKWGILSPGKNSVLTRPLKDMSPEDFPIWSDFKDYVTEVLDKGERAVVPADDQEEDVNIRSEQIVYVQNIELQVEDLCSQYGNIFNGHTTIKDIYKEQLICFDVKNLVNMEEGVFDAQLFSALSLCWDNAVSVGAEMRRLDNEGRVDEKDIIHTLIIVDEAHRFINAKKLAGVEQITLFEREGRKWSTGIALASQSIRDFVPDGSSDAAADQIKKIFELSTYKWILNQDANCKQKLTEIFSGDFTETNVETVPKLEKGDVMLAVTGEPVIEFHVDLSEAEDKLFMGGR